MYTGGAIANEIIHIIKKAKLGNRYCGRKGHSRTNTMSSKPAGLKARIKALSEKAVYTYCNWKNVSLIVVCDSELAFIKYILEKA